MIEQLQFELNAETAFQLTNELFSKDFLTSGPAIVGQYLSTLSGKLSLANAAEYVRRTLIGYVLQFYSDNKTELKFTIEQRFGVFSILFDALAVLMGR